MEDVKKYGETIFEVDLKNYNTFKIGGKARCLINVTDKNNLIELIKYLKNNNIKYFVLGNGSNVVFSDKYFDGVIIKLRNLNKFQIDVENKVLKADAGVYFPALVPEIVKTNMKGFEWAAGLPGTIGGSVVSNAGCYKSSIFDFLISVTVIYNGDLKVMYKDEIPHGYRYSFFQDNKDYIILEAHFLLEEGNMKESQQIILDRQKRRLESQPLEYPSAGSIFRNPDEENTKDIIKKHNLKGPFAGHLIEMCGLKGKKIGGAQISEKHANFIVNIDNASSQDVKDLIDFVHKSVLEKYGIDLVIEQEFVNWE